MKRLLFLLLPFLFITTLVTSIAARPVPARSSAASGDERWVVRAHFDDRNMVNELARWREPWEVNDDKGYVILDVNQEEEDRLREAGFQVEIDAVLTAELNQPRAQLPGQMQGIPGYPCYRTVEETFATAEELATSHPELVTWADVGDSWEKIMPGASPGYDLVVLQLTNSAISGPKPKLFVMSSAHAREYVTAELTTRFAEYLVHNYGSSPDITWLLDYHEIHLLPYANPDGRKLAEKGVYWRKNTNENYCSALPASRGADLNRNFSFYWGCCEGSNENSCSEVYRGPEPASEPETQAIQAYVRSHFPDQRDAPLSAPAPSTATGVFIDLHSYGELVLWPWGFSNEIPPNGAALQSMGRKLAYFNGYKPQQSIALYPTDGTTEAFAYGELGVAAYTFELGTKFFQSCTVFENEILPKNLRALLYAAKVARTPYLTPSGPDILNASVSGSVAVGESVTLNARVDDTRYSRRHGIEPTQNAVAAEFYINTPPWVTTTVPISHTMTAVDGSFDSSAEDVQALLDTSDLGVGKHVIYIRGRDEANNWGPVSAVYLFIYDPNVSPLIQGHVREGGSQQPLQATISFNDYFTITTNAETGFYSTRVLSGTYQLKVRSPAYGSQTTGEITARNHQFLQQNFTLYPFCPLTANDAESELSGWTLQSPWTATTEQAHSPTHAWSDSPGDDYVNNQDASLISPVFDLSAYTDIRLSFWHICRTEKNYDFCRVEISKDDGKTWTEVAKYDGYSTDWQEEVISLPALKNVAEARIRLRLTSDNSINNDGWYIDDIQLAAAGPVCTGVSPEMLIYMPLVANN